MASAVLASRNEPQWGEPKVYVRRYPNTTSATLNNNINNPLFRAKPNPNPNKLTRARDPSSNQHFREIALQAVITDLPSSKRQLLDSSEAKETSRAGHVTFNLGACTRRELKDLRKRLFSDLERVRMLRIRIENSNFAALPTYPVTHQLSQLPSPPLLQLPYAGDAQKPSSNRIPKGRKKGRVSRRGSNPRAKRATTAPSTKNLLRRCSQILTKLMKHQHGWVFNAPVDVVSLQLHDYHAIIKKPMDLGTVKLNLKMNFYSSPLDFAEDVRLTFNNALKYNPKGHSVYVLAETLLTEFEKMFDKLPQQQQPILVTQEAALLRPKVRAMSLEEKKVLGRSLEELPQEEVVELLGIVKKRNGEFSRDGDDIELNIDTLDNDTLWELDQFVGNYKSKTEREPIYGQVHGPAPAAVESEMMVIERSKKVEVGEDDVDIGEEIPAGNFPPVVIERDVNSSSSGSGSDSSSSKGSEFGNESDDDSVHSPFVEQKDDHGT